MHVISDDSTVADTIRYDTPSIGSDTDPIIVRFPILSGTTTSFHCIHGANSFDRCSNLKKYFA